MSENRGMIKMRRKGSSRHWLPQRELSPACGGFGTLWNLCCPPLGNQSLTTGISWRSKRNAFFSGFQSRCVLSSVPWLPGAASLECEGWDESAAWWMGSGRSGRITCLGDEHPCDIMVVQELGNVWPGWRGLGKGSFTPNRFLSPPWGENNSQEIYLYSISEDLESITFSAVNGLLFAKHPW